MTGEQLRGVSKELTTLSVAFGNAFNISDQDAFNMIQGGLVGAGGNSSVMESSSMTLR